MLAGIIQPASFYMIDYLMKIFLLITDSALHSLTMYTPDSR